MLRKAATVCHLAMKNNISTLNSGRSLETDPRQPAKDIDGSGGRREDRRGESRRAKQLMIVDEIRRTVISLRIVTDEVLV
jgi:hypothetical protein